MGIFNMFSKESILAKLGKQDISKLLSTFNIDIDQVFAMGETKLAEWLQNTQQQAGSKLLLMAELDDETQKINIQFHKLNGTETEHWKTIHLSELKSFLAELKNTENDTTVFENSTTDTEPRAALEPRADTANGND